ncbi:putative ribonuclease H-like domain-containing protein [Tanacetum coccineum]|uniref:Ribonuclease H-like domain-containing protein n=1 Tax=Tanacetum coccineum TaxID=301880 RepID=A0ABQ5I9I7_9ASTR
MSEFCEKKGIKREFSVARAPQQNGVTERRNRTPIEAARTMLADYKLPTTFYAETFNTACYVQNRVLVVKSYNKTPYELFRGRTPALSFMRPFGCHVTILITFDHLGKFDGKSGEGFFIGYSLNSKAFKAYNIRTRKVEENLHVRFLKDKPIITGAGPKWLFDIDVQTESINYVLVVAGTNSNDSEGTKESIGASHSSKEIGSCQDCILMPLWKDGILFDSSSKNASNDEPQPSNDNGKKDDNSEIDNQKRPEKISSTPNTRIHKDHSLAQVIGDIQSSVQTRRMINEQGFISDVYKGKSHEDLHNCLFACFLSQEEPKKRGQIDKTLFIKKIKGDILLVQVYLDDIIFGSTKKVLCTQFEKLMHKKFQICSMGELTFFLGLQVTQKDDGIFISQDKSMIGSLMYLTTSRPDIMFVVYACARFQVTPKVSHLHAVKRIFRYLKGQPKLGVWYLRDSPFDLEDFLDNDYTGASLDRTSTAGGCQFLGKRLISWQCKKQTVVANSTTKVEYVAAANCWGQVLWIQNQMLDYGFNFMNTKIYIDNESTICIVKNPVFHSKTKHIEIRHHFIRDSYEKKLIQVIKIHTDHNVADLLTKAFDVSRKSKRTTEISQSIGSIPLVTYETIIKEWEDRMERAATIASSLEAEQDSGNINRNQVMATLNESFPQGTDSGSGPRCQDTILGVVEAQTRLDNQSIERDRLIGIGFVLNFMKFISFTFGDKEMISVIEAVSR